MPVHSTSARWQSQPGKSYQISTTEVVTETRFHHLAGIRFEWLTAGAELFVNDGRNFCLISVSGTLALHLCL